MREGAPRTPEQRRHAIEAELRALRELEAPAAVWPAVERRLDARKRRQRSFLKPAFAAGGAAAAAAALSVVAFLSDGNSGSVDGSPGSEPHQSADSQAAPAVPQRLVAELMERSRLAEARRRSLPVYEGARLAAAPGATMQGSTAQGASVQGMEARRLLAARIAAVDASLNRLATVEPADSAAQERLWRERVELMDTLMRAEQVQRDEFIRRAVY